MENIPGDKSDEYGCFVYHVLKTVNVQTCKSVDDKSGSGQSFNEGDLVSIDLIRPSRFSKSKNGPFLRLTDDSGWLFEKKSGEIFLQRLPVTSGLWCFYIDNRMSGIDLRRHPFDGSPHVDPRVYYPPMQMIYCDRKVVNPSNNGVASYRVQGTNNGWLFDMRLNQKVSPTILLTDSSVQTGLFAYELLENIAVRLKPTVSRSDSVNSQIIIRKTEIVCCDAIIRGTYPKFDDYGNGPYLRLTDGTGWIFKKRADYDPKITKSLTIDNGNWSFQVVNGGGIELHKQPIDRKDMTTNILYSPGNRVDCDKKITSSISGVSFYRVVGTEGWVFDRRRNGEPMMKMLKSNGLTNPEPFVLGDDQSPWDVAFLRGMAEAYDLNEISHNITSRCISFRNNNDRINIYYSTRTIGTALDHPSQGKTQLFRRKCTVEDLKKIFQYPRSHSGKGYKRRPSDNGIAKKEVAYSTPHGRGVYLDEEEYVRNSLIECDTNISTLYKERDSILKSIKRHDDRHALVATKMKIKTDDHEKQLANTAADKVRQEAAAKAAAQKERLRLAAAAEEERIRLAKFLTCGECYREFSSEHARDQHCRDAHDLQCNYCGRTFKSQNGLNSHRNAVDHW